MQLINVPGASQIWNELKNINAYKLLGYELKIWKRPSKVETILDVTNNYMLKIKNKFLKEVTDKKKKDIYNKNIDAVFYLKRDFQSIILDDKNELEEKWKRRILIESTPRGNIIMFYNSYKQGFSYYSDINSIPYALLNSVAMKYVLIYHCVDFFVDNEIMEDIFESPFIKIYYTEEKKEVKPEETNEKRKENLEFQRLLKNAPFIKYKKKILQENLEFTTPTTIQKEYVRNRFICLGKTINFQFLKKVEKKQPAVRFDTEWTGKLDGETNLQKEVMNYKNYKNSIKKTQ
jgi:hypothetical protein